MLQTLQHPLHLLNNPTGLWLVVFMHRLDRNRSMPWHTAPEGAAAALPSASKLLLRQG